MLRVLLLPGRPVRSGPHQARQVSEWDPAAGRPTHHPARHRRRTGAGHRTSAGTPAPRTRAGGARRPTGGSPSRSPAGTSSTARSWPSRGRARRTSDPHRPTRGGSPSRRGSRTGRSCRHRTRARRPSREPRGRTAGGDSSWFAHPPPAGPTPNRPHPARPVRPRFADRTAATTPTAGSPDDAHEDSPGHLAGTGHRTQPAPRAAPSPADGRQRPIRRIRPGGQ